MTLYHRIAGEIQDRIASGTYRPGEKIPSIRRMAVEFGCTKATVQKAFEHLQRQGVIENTVGSGSFVRFPEKVGSAAERVDFRSDYISEAFFPYKSAQAIFSDIFEEERHRALAPPPVAGEPELIKMLGAYYQVPTDRMLIVSGAQQGLDLIAKVFAAQISEAILFEDPTYPMAISRFKARHFVPMADDGPRLDLLDEKLTGQIRLFYAMPAVHNPTGISYSREKRAALMERAVRFGFTIIEDDALGEFIHQPIPRFIDLLPERTLFIKSLAQTMTAGIRLGFMIVPSDLYDKFLHAKYTSDIFSTGLVQKFAARFIRNGGYRAYIDETGTRLDIRRRRVLELLKSHVGLFVNPGQTGFSIWVRSDTPLTLPHRPWCGGEEFSFSPEFRNYFRMSLLGMDDPDFENGLVFVGQLLDRMFDRE